MISNIYNIPDFFTDNYKSNYQILFNILIGLIFIIYSYFVISLYKCIIYYIIKLFGLTNIFIIILGLIIGITIYNIFDYYCNSLLKIMINNNKKIFDLHLHISNLEDINKSLDHKNKILQSIIDKQEINYNKNIYDLKELDTCTHADTHIQTFAPQS